MTGEKSYCFYNTMGLRQVHVLHCCLHFAGLLLSGYWSIIVDLKSRASVL